MIDPAEQYSGGLDQLLKEARWPVPLEGAEQRLRLRLLETQGEEQSFWSPWSWRLTQLSAAAAILVALLMLYFWPRHQPMDVQRTQFAGPVAAEPRLAPLEIVGRPLNLEDRLALIESKLPIRRVQQSTELSQPVEVPRLVATLDEIRRAMADPSRTKEVPLLIQTATVGTLEELTNEQSNVRWHTSLASELLTRGPAGVAAVLNMLSDPIRRDTARYSLGSQGAVSSNDLIRQFASPLVQTRLAAAYELGHSCTVETVVRLIDMTHDGRQARVAVAALINCRQPEARAFVCAYQSDPRGGVSHQQEIRLLRHEMAQFD